MLLNSLLPNFLVILVCLFTSGIGAFLGTYLREKGKNLATKEDTGDIQKELAKVTVGVQSEIERLKAEVTYSWQHRMVLQTEERSVLVRFYCTLNQIIHRLSGQAFKEQNNPPAIGDLFSKYIQSESEVDLFFEDEEFSMAKKDLMEVLSNLSSHLEIKEQLYNGMISREGVMEEGFNFTLKIVQDYTLLFQEHKDFLENCRETIRELIAVRLRATSDD